MPLTHVPTKPCSLAIAPEHKTITWPTSFIRICNCIGTQIQLNLNPCRTYLVTARRRVWSRARRCAIPWCAPSTGYTSHCRLPCRWRTSAQLPSSSSPLAAAAPRLLDSLCQQRIWWWRDPKGAQNWQPRWRGSRSRGAHAGGKVGKERAAWVSVRGEKQRKQREEIVRQMGPMETKWPIYLFRKWKSQYFPVLFNTYFPVLSSTPIFSTVELSWLDGS